LRLRTAKGEIANRAGRLHGAAFIRFRSALSLAHSMRQLPSSSERSHEEHDAPKVLRLDHLHRIITTNGKTLANSARSVGI
jgi:hypothetical protein